MKKLKLNLQNIEGAAFLTREQLKTVIGGSGGENGSGGGCPCGESCDTGSTITNPSTGEVDKVYGTCSGLDDYPEQGCVCV